MSLFDTLFPKQTRSASRRPSARTRATNRRHRGEAFGEQLEQRLALAVVTPFAPRFTANVQGDITFAANTIMTAVAGLPGTPAQVADAQNGTNLTGDAPAIWNDDFWVMQFIDIDADATTFSSSSAVLDIPAGSEVLFAGLYWGGRVLGTTQFDAADNVKFRGPGDSGYQDLTATVFSSTTQGAPTTGARNYQGFKDVTSLVQARGEGTYTVANVQANEGKNYSAGWSLVVAYRDNTDLPRNLTVFDGFAYVTTADPDVTIPFSGFRAPLSGPVNATLGFVVYEGDLGITGDSAFFDGGLGESELSNATNPANNFFNSSISNRGVTVTAKTPNYKNQLGFDTDLVEADGLIANNATSATLRLTTTQDFYYPGVITSAIEVYAPKTVVTKSGQDLNAGLVEPGDVLRYTITVSNEASAYDTAKDVVLNDVIPAFTSYKLGSLVITSGANAGAKTDAIDTDQAEFIAGGNGAVRFRLGTGATGATVPTPSGGTLAAGQSTTVTFEVIVGEYPSSAVIENLASVSYSGTFFGPFTRTADFDFQCPPVIDLAITKSSPGSEYVPGEPATYSFTVANNGPAASPGSIVTDALPAQTTFNPALNPGWTLVGTTLTYATPALGSGGSTSFALTLLPASSRLGDLVNTATVAVPPGFFDRNLSNNTATETDTARPTVGLSVSKTDGSATYIPGDPVTYTIVVSNSGPSDLVGGSVVDLLPSVATSGAWTTSTAGGATVLPTTGGNNINATVNIPKSGSVTFTYTVQTKPIVIPIDPVTGPYPDLFNLVTVFLPQGTAGNTATATDNDTAAPQVDLAVTKTRTSPLPVIAGEIVTYSIVVTSNGPSSITTFSGTDVTVPGLLSPTYSVSTGTYDPNTGIWTADPGDTFDDGESVTFTFSGTVPANATGTLTNTASGTPPIFDPNPDNNTSTATDTIVVKPVLSITKTDNATIYVPGTTTTYTIVATNAGPSFLAGGTVSDPLPAQVSSATWTAVYSAGSSGPESGSGPLNETVDLAPGGTATFTFTVQIKPDATGDLVNTVTITPPPNTQGNTATATDTNTISNPQLLLNVTKTDGKTTYLPNETFTYTIVVSNSGPSTMVDGVVNDPLPSQVATGSWTASYSAGSSGPASGSGGITNEKITLLPGGNATFLLTVTIRSDAFGQMDNTVTLTPPAGIVVTPGSVLSATDTNFGPEPPASIGGALVVGSDDGCNGPPWVRVLDPNSGVELSRFLAYDARFRGSVRVAVGDVTGDGVAEIITAPSRNLVGEVRVFQRNLFGAAQQNGLSEWSELTQYRTLAFGPRYRGGVEVAVADIDGDRVNDIVTAMSIQSGMVNVFKVTLNGGDPVANTPFKSFRGAPVGTNNGVMISAGDYINGGILGGPAEIAVGTNSGTRALVRIFDVSGTPKVVRSFNPFANGFRGGVTLSTADYDGNGSLDLIVGAGLNGGSRVEVWNPATTSRIAQTSVFSSLAKPNARVFAVFGSAADGFLGPDSTLYGVQGLNGGRGSKGVWKVLSGKAESLVNSQTSLPPLRIAPIGLPLAPIAPRLG
ncbi:MAG: hypothetical protein ACK6DO_06805 [Planctomycetia bacterium]